MSPAGIVPEQRVGPWPSANQYVEAIQNPQSVFSDDVLKAGHPALTRLGMPHVASGNFAYVFKFTMPQGDRAIKCFRQYLGDRERRYIAIDEYLDAHRIASLPRFEYESQGILVAGSKYPILVMEWIEGPTLDVYVDALLKQSTAASGLRAVADEWCVVTEQLQASGAAHGDLQHGNVIVSRGVLRLVDLDGMNVPALTGLRAAEVGHRHFQHPKRTDEMFDPNIDKFPGLVIYLSLVALSENASLWPRFHDDNLIFTWEDFVAPDRSALFQELRKGSTEVRRLTEALAEACLRPPSASPALNSLVGVKTSKLPAWMRDHGIVDVVTRTREAGKDQGGVRWAPPAAPSPSAAGGVTTAGQVRSATRPTTRPPLATSAVANWPWIKKGLGNGLGFAFIGLFFTWLWFPLIGGLLTAALQMKFRNPEHTLATVFVYLLGTFGLGLYVAHRDVTSPKKASRPVATPRPGPHVPVPAPGYPHPPHTTTTTTHTAGSTVIGSTIRLIYHRPSCEWAIKISRRNRTSFSSSAAARSSGYRPCRVCHP